MKLFRFLFYRLYQLMISVGNKDLAEFCAILLMTMTLFLNYITLKSLLYVFTKINKNILDIPNTIVLTIAFVLVSIFYLSFAREKKFLEIKMEYENESRKKLLTGRLVVICYLVLSYLLFSLGLYLMMMKNRGEL
ncbi:hypothetical protein [Bacteroides sedimenti]|uniref:ABC transporter permease n=1 Tax=Bacteroides sedimenti TaxID=2136147 RepID=A0ABN6Z0U4_9BACE